MESAGRTAVAEPSVTCRAPHVAMRFSPDGRVHVCCVNEQYELGRIGERTIRGIWTGAELEALRRAMAVADYRQGCQDCGVLYATGQRHQTHAVEFDRFEEPSAWPRRMEFALSNTCNLQCIQCSGDLSSSIRAQREGRPPLRSPYGDAFFEELQEFLPHVRTAVFIGGEPFLAAQCRRVWDLLLELDARPDVHVTTNGTVWDSRVEHYVHELRMNITVSMDGCTPSVNDSIRIGSVFSEVKANRDRFLAATRSYGGGFSINHCLMTRNWRDLGAFLLAADDDEVPVHVIPVSYPPDLSLLCLPEAELAAVVDQLEAQDADLASMLETNAGAWSGVLGHLRLQLGIRRGAGTPVELRPHAFIARDQVLLEDLERELRRWSPEEPVVVDVRDGVVERVVEGGAWSSPLAPGRWLGGPAPAILTELRIRMGPVPDLELQGRPGIRDVTGAIRTGSGSMPFRIGIAEWHEGLARCSRMVITASPAAVDP